MSCPEFGSLLLCGVSGIHFSFWIVYILPLFYRCLPQILYDIGLITQAIRESLYTTLNELSSKIVDYNAIIHKLLYCLE